MSRGQPVAQDILPPQPSSVGRARHLVRDGLLRAGREDLVEIGELLVSELVTNALVHAATDVLVEVVADASGARVAVCDGSSRQPSLRHRSALAGTGRGLHLLEDLADRWGTGPRADSAPGKSVWFELGSAPGPAPTAGAGDRASGVDGRPEDADRAGWGDVVEVDLVNVPLLLHVAWQEMAGALLREYLLYRIGEDSGADELQTHAASSDALAIMVEQIAEPALDIDRDDLVSKAVEPLVSSERERLRIPVESLEHFRVLDETLDAAIALANDGVFLNVPVQPELREFRRWVCQEVVNQHAGQPPTPWPARADGDLHVPRPEVHWDDTAITRSDRALVAADDTDAIIAVSESAVELLGYRSAGELVGRRLVVIIPSRYRQAHLAGFALNLAIGRSRLLGHSVRVPTLRADGSEVMLSLTLESEALDQGRRVFVAALGA